MTGMNRLTHKARYEAGYKLNAGAKQWEAYDRLGNYEKIGLEPDQIQELKERDTAKERELINGGVPVCPVCGAKVFAHYAFCRDCGQRLKRED